MGGAGSSPVFETVIGLRFKAMNGRGKMFYELSMGKQYKGRSQRLSGNLHCFPGKYDICGLLLNTCVINYFYCKI